MGGVLLGFPVPFGVNGLNNTLYAGTGNNVLNGGGGTDTVSYLYGVTGGAGLDSFRFDTALNASTNLDRITDFNPTDDTIQLENSLFTQLTGTTPFTLSDANFWNTTVGTKGATDYIVYNPTTGALYYDTNGGGAGLGTLFATIWATASTHPTFTRSDFVVT